MSPVNYSVQVPGGLIELPGVPVTRAFARIARLTVHTS
jgi:hypothetical protein